MDDVSAQQVLDALPSPAVVIDGTAVIVAVNAAWDDFGADNGRDPGTSSLGVEYLAVCPEGTADAIRAVLAGRQPDLVVEYPCHSPDEEHWFRMTVRPLGAGALVIHDDITGEYLRISRWLDATGVAVIELTPSLALGFANASWRRVVGPLHDSWTSPLEPEDAEELHARLAEAAATRQEFTTDVRVGGRWFRFVVTPHVGADHSLRRIIIVGLDVTTERLIVARHAADRERVRMAAELHDSVMQRLYGMALALQRKVRDGYADSAVLEDAVGRLDRSIADLRAIARQPQPRADGGSIGRRLGSVLSDATMALGFRPSVRVDGDPEQIDDQTAHHLMAVLSESLSNVARHAHAMSTDVHLVTRGGKLTLTVADDGIGMPAEMERRSGTSHMSARAEVLGGRALWAPAPLGGTVFTWQVPLGARSAPAFEDAASLSDNEFADADLSSVGSRSDASEPDDWRPVGPSDADLA